MAALLSPRDADWIAMGSDKLKWYRFFPVRTEKKINSGAPDNMANTWGAPGSRIS